MDKKTKPNIVEGSHYDSTEEPADQSNTGLASHAISDQADFTSVQSMSGQNSCHPPTLQELNIPMITDQLIIDPELINLSSLDQSLIDLAFTDLNNQAISLQSSRKRKVSSAAGSAEQERQHGKEARTASTTHPSRSSHSEGNAPMISNDETAPQSNGTNGAPQTNPPTSASTREHLDLAIRSEEQEHETRKHEIGLRGVMIKDKVDMVVAHKRVKSKRLAEENIQILKGKQQNPDEVTINNDVPSLSTLKQVSYKPGPINKLDIVPLFGDVNDGASPPTQDNSTYGIGKGFKSLDMPCQSQGQPTYGIGKESKGVSICDIEKESKLFDNPELPADSLSMSTSDSQPNPLEPNTSAIQKGASVAELLNPNSDSADIQNDTDYPGGTLPDEIIDGFLRFFELQNDELPTSPKSNISESSLIVSNNTMSMTPSAIGRNEQGLSHVSVIATFQCPFNSPCVRMCQHTTQKQCWLTEYQNRVIRLVDKKGSVIKTINSNSMAWVLGIAMIGTNKLLVCKNNRCISQIVLPDDTMSTVFYTSLIPRDICVTPTGELLITMSDTHNLFIVPKQSCVVKYTPTGYEVKRSPMCDQFGDRLFVWPHKVSVNHRGDRVAVVNFTTLRRSEMLSHLVMLDGNLDLVARYINHRQSVPRDTKYNGISPAFCIPAVQFDNYNNVLIAEHYSKSVQLLDSDCGFLRVLTNYLRDIPISLAVDVDEDVWIWHESKSVKIIRYL